MNQVECIKSNGGTITIPSEKLILRPAAYGIIPYKQSLLLIKSVPGERYHLPGGDIQLGERIEDGLRRKFLEEFKLKIDVQQFLGFKEHFFFVESTNQAYQEIQFYYFCLPCTADPADIGELFWNGSIQAHWVKIETLKSQDFQNNGEYILQMLKSVTSLQEFFKIPIQRNS